LIVPKKVKINDLPHLAKDITYLDVMHTQKQSFKTKQNL